MYIYVYIYIYYHQPVLQQSCHAALGRCDEHRCFLWRLLDNGRCFRDDLVRRFMPFLHMSRHKASCSCTCPCTCMHACIMHAIQATAWQSGWGGFSGAWDVCCCKTWSYIQFMNAHACCYTHSQAPHDTLQQGEFPVPKTKCCCQKSYLYVIRIQGTASHTGCSGVSGSLEAGMIATFWRCRVDVSLLPQHRRGQLRVIAEVNLKSSCNMATVCDLVNVCMPCHVFWHPTWHCWVHWARFHCRIFFRHNLIFRSGLLLGILIQVNWLIVTVPLWIFRSSSLLCRYRKPKDTITDLKPASRGRWPRRMRSLNTVSMRRTPHACRLMNGPDHKNHMPACIDRTHMPIFTVYRNSVSIQMYRYIYIYILIWMYTYIYREHVCAYDVITPVFVLLLLLLLPLLTYAHNIVPLGQQWQYKLPVPIAIYIYRYHA